MPLLAWAVLPAAAARRRHQQQRGRERRPPILIETMGAHTHTDAISLTRGWVAGADVGEDDAAQAHPRKGDDKHADEEEEEEQGRGAQHAVCRGGRPTQQASRGCWRSHCNAWHVTPVVVWH